MLIRVVDCETTGLDPAVHRVCEIATVDVIVDLDHRTKYTEGLISRGRMWSSLVNPGIPIPPEASAVHDITDDMVKDAPTIPEITAAMREVEQPDYYCAHNNRFDEKFIKVGPWLDTYRIALWLWPSAPEHKLATLRYWLKLSLSIADIAGAMGIVPTHKDRSWLRGHAALWDAYLCAAVLRRAFTAGATIEQMVEVSSQPALLPRFTFGAHAMKPIEEVPRDYLDWILSPRGIKDNEDVTHTAFAELQRRRNLDRLHNA